VHESPSNFASGQGARRKSYLGYFDDEQHRHGVKGPATQVCRQGSGGLENEERLLIGLLAQALQQRLALRIQQPGNAH